MKLSDAMVTGLSSALAFCAAGFAGYMLAYGPPERADPIVTGTIVRGDSASLQALLPPGFFSSARRFDYALQRVTGGTAYVSIGNGVETVTVPIRQGSMVPGIGPARAIGRRNAGWVVRTGTLEITEEGVSVER
jgi:hypothetical protein